jgi:nicotinamide mononucleotide transporter
VSPIELFGVLSGMATVWLATRQNIWCWPSGLVSSSLFVAIFYEAKLYGAMGLQVVYIGLCIYGWYSWLHGGPQHSRLTVSRTSRRLLLAFAAGGAVVTAVLGTWLDRRTDAALPYLDAGTTSFSLAAQWLQARKRIENWAVWLVVDSIYVGMNLSRGLVLTAGLYAVYLGLAVVGFRQWRQSMHAAASAGGAKVVAAPASTVDVQ